MSLSPKQAFQIGFTLRCADEGLSPEETQERVQRAAKLIEKKAFIGSALKSVLGAGTTLGLMLPIGLGAGGGYLAAKMSDDPVDADDLQKQELLREYKRLTRAARQQKKLKLLRQRSL